MKKALSFLLAFALLIGSLPVMQMKVFADEPVNLAADYTLAGGQITYSNLDSWGGSWVDSKDTAEASVAGGYGWVFGPNCNFAQGKLGYFNIAAADLKANTTYQFSYYYQSKFKVLPGTVADPKGNILSEVYPETDVKIGTGRGNSSHQVTFEFTTNAAGTYTITLKTSTDEQYYNRDYSGSDWAMFFSDLCLYETDKNYNLAKDYAYGTEITGVADSWNGGTSFYGDGNVKRVFGTDNHVTKPGYYEVTMANLEANTYYEFSYLYSTADASNGSRSGRYRSFVESVSDPSGEVLTNAEIAPQYVVGKRPGTESLWSGMPMNGDVYKASVGFVTDVAGTYKVTLRMSQIMTYSDTVYLVLSDLRLVQMPNRDLASNLAASYGKGTGNVGHNWLAGSWYPLDQEDTKTQSLNGGYAWTYGGHDSNKTDGPGTVSVLLEGLRANTRYTYSYVYQGRYAIHFKNIYGQGNAIEPVSVKDVSLGCGEGAHRVTVEFVTSAKGDYTVNMRMSSIETDTDGNADYRNPDYTGSDWYARLSDLYLGQTADDGNLLSDALVTNGGVLVDLNMDYWGNDYEKASPYDGVEWIFGLGNTTVDTYGKTYIYASNLKANTKYTFTYKYYGLYTVSFDSLGYITRKTSGNNYPLTTVSNDAVAKDVLLESIGTNKPHEVSYTFTTDQAGTYVLILKASKEYQTGNAALGWNTRLADLVLKETAVSAEFTSPSEETVAKTGVSMRQAVSSQPQALRYKNTISAQTLESKELAQNGYTLVEYGSVVMRTEFLDGADLRLTDKINNHRVFKGAAYSASAGKDIRFAENEDGSITFTAALYNIGQNALGDVDYAVWGKAYTVRAYALFRNATGDERVVYGDAVSTSVFDLIKTILSFEGQENLDEQTLSDIAYVRNLLENTEISDAYNAWNSAGV